MSKNHWLFAKSIKPAQSKPATKEEMDEFLKRNKIKKLPTVYVAALQSITNVRPRHR